MLVNNCTYITARGEIVLCFSILREGGGDGGGGGRGREGGEGKGRGKKVREGEEAEDGRTKDVREEMRGRERRERRK